MEKIEPLTINTTNGAKVIADATPQRKARRPKEATEYTGKGKVIVLLPQTGRPDEVRTFRINGKPYHIKTGQPVNVPDFLYAHIMDLNNRKKLSVKAMQAFSGDGKGLGDLK